VNCSGATRALAASVAILALSGCLHEEGRLKGEIEDVTPSGFEQVDCSFASGWFGGESASESCVFVVRDAGMDETEARLRRALAQKGRPVRVEEGGGVVELNTSGGGVDYRARIGATPGLLAHYLAPPAFPPGSVGVVLYASEER
jgi:hypothetical protein